MNEVGTGAVRGTGKPSWIDDKVNQEKWTGQFIEILKRDYEDLDAAISAIVRDRRLADLCATRIRSYVDRAVTDHLNAQSKTREAIVVPHNSLL